MTARRSDDLASPTENLAASGARLAAPPSSPIPVDPVLVPPMELDSLMLVEEAARYGGKTVRDLLRAALSAEVVLMFECPADAHVVLRPAKVGIDENDVGHAEPLRTPEYFVLRPEFCRALLDRSSVHVSEASCGYQKSSGGSGLRCLPASDADGQLFFPVQIRGVDSPVVEERNGVPRLRWERWVLWANSSPFRYPVRHDDLLIKKKEFFGWMGWRKAPKPTTAYLPEQIKPKKADLDDGHDFLSPQLLRMCEAAHKFWGQEGIVRDNPRTHPSEDAIVDFLTDSDGLFSRTSAEDAARLIKPAFAPKAGAKPK